MDLSCLHGAMCLELPAKSPPAQADERFQAKPDLLGLSVVASCVCLSGGKAAPGSLSGLCTGKNFLCFSVTYTLKMHLTLEIGSHIKQLSATNFYGGGGSADSTPTVTGVSPDSMRGKWLCPNKTALTSETNCQVQAWHPS